MDSENKQEVNEELDKKVSALKAIVETYALLSKGFYQPENFERAKRCSMFLESLHEELMNECLRHPHAASFPELREEIVKRLNEEEKANE